MSKYVKRPENSGVQTPYKQEWRQHYPDSNIKDSLDTDISLSTYTDTSESLANQIYKNARVLYMWLPVWSPVSGIERNWASVPQGRRKARTQHSPAGVNQRIHSPAGSMNGGRREKHTIWRKLVATRASNRSSPRNVKQSSTYSTDEELSRTLTSVSLKLPRITSESKNSGQSHLTANRSAAQFVSCFHVSFTFIINSGHF